MGVAGPRSRRGPANGATTPIAGRSGGETAGGVEAESALAVDRMSTADDSGTIT
jgi:hypothetical protein